MPLGFVCCLCHTFSDCYFVTRVRPCKSFRVSSCISQLLQNRKSTSFMQITHPSAKRTFCYKNRSISSLNSPDYMSLPNPKNVILAIYQARDLWGIFVRLEHSPCIGLPVFNNGFKELVQDKFQSSFNDTSQCTHGSAERKKKKKKNPKPKTKPKTKPKIKKKNNLAHGVSMLRFLLSSPKILMKSSHLCWFLHFPNIYLMPCQLGVITLLRLLVQPWAGINVS